MEFVSLIVILIFVFIGMPLFLLPTIVAVVRGHSYWFVILLLNVLGGLIFGIGWLIALIWAFIDDAPTRSGPDMASQIQKLHELKEKGALTQQEFERAKRRVLG